MKTILVPIDFSDNSKNALDYAILLAKKLKMKLLLLHVFYPTITSTIKDSYQIAAHKKITGTSKEMKEQLEMWHEALMSSEKKLESQSVFVEGELITEIGKLVKKNKISLVIMGTKGASGLKEVFIGSNALHVIETVSCPVLAIPEGHTYSNIKKIIFATDYHGNDIASIRSIVQMAELLDWELHILHVADGELTASFEKELLQHFQKKIKRLITYKKIKFHLLKGTDVRKSLNEYIIKNNSDLLALATKERILTSTFLNRGITKKMAHHIQIPLLTFHASDKNLFEF